MAYIDGRGNWQTGGSTTIATTGAAWSVSTGNAILVSVRINVSASWPANHVTGVADTAGNTYQRACAKHSQGGDVVELWYALDITGHASNVVTATFNTSLSFRGITASEVSGLVALHQIATGISVRGSPITSFAYSTGYTNTYVFAAMQVGAAGQTWTAGTGFTKRTTDGSEVMATMDRTHAGAVLRQTASASVTSSASSCMALAVFTTDDSEDDGIAGNKQVFLQQGQQSSGAWYYPLGAPQALGGAGSVGMWGLAGFLRNFKVDINVAPGTGKSYVFRIYVNLHRTDAIVTIADSATSGTYSGPDIPIGENEEVIVACDGVGSPAAIIPCFATEFESIETKKSCYAPQSLAGGIDNLTRYSGVFNPTSGAVFASVPGRVQSVAPGTGTITRILWRVRGGFGYPAIADGSTYTITMYKNGVKQDGTGGTVNTVLTATSAADYYALDVSLSVEPGDTFYYELTSSTSFAIGSVTVATVFEADENGRSFMCGFVNGLTPSGFGDFSLPESWGDSSFAAEANRSVFGAVLDISLSKLYVVLTGAPGSGKSFTFNMRKNGATPGGVPTVTISDLATTGNATGTYSAISTDTLSFQCDDVGSPTQIYPVWGMLLELAVDASEPGPGPVDDEVFAEGLIEMCFHTGSSFRTWIKHRGGGVTAKRFWWLGDVGTTTATDDMTEDPQIGVFGTYEVIPTKVRDCIPEYGLATWFDGSQQRVLTFSGMDGILGGNFTLIALIRPDGGALTGLRCVYQTGSPGSAYLGIEDGFPVFGVNGGTLITSDLELQGDRNYLLVGTYDGTDGTLFAAECVIGATIHETGPTALTFTTSHGVGTIGANETSEYFLGAIQHVAELEGDPAEAVVDMDDVIGLHSTTYWTDVTPDVEGTVTIDRGIHDDGPLARMAATGKLTLTMDNSHLNTAGLEGYYSPDHANVRNGFQEGIPIRVSLLDAEASPEQRVIQFIGTIQTISIVPGIYRERRAFIVATDWMDEAARTSLRALPAMTGVRSDDVVAAILNSMRNRPHMIDLQEGSDTYTIALHNTTDEKTVAQQELLKVEQTELGLLYVRGDGTLVHEARYTRSLSTAVDYALDKFLTVEQERHAPRAKNAVRVTVHPARLGSDPEQILYTMSAFVSPADDTIRIDNGVTTEIFLPFRDDTVPTARIGGVDVIEPVQTTDYLINANEDGSGADLTGHPLIAVEFRIAGNGVYLRVTNSYGNRVWIPFLQVRGRAVYDFEPVTVIARNKNSIDEIGEQEVTIDMPYQGQTGVGQGAADYLLGVLSTKTTRLKTATFWADYSALHWQAALYGEISSRIQSDELMSGVDGEFFVISKKIVWKPSGNRGPQDIDITFGLTPVDVSTGGQFWILDVSTLDESTVLAYV